MENKQITSPSTSNKSTYIILLGEKSDEEQDSLKISLHNLLINYNGTNNNLTAETPQGHHLIQDTDETHRHQVPPVRMHQEGCSTTSMVPLPKMDYLKQS